MADLMMVTYGSEHQAKALRERLDAILDEIRAAGGRVMHAALSDDQESRVQAALDEGAGSAPAAAASPSEKTASSASPSRPDLSSGEPGDPAIGTTPAALGIGTLPQT